MKTLNALQIAQLAVVAGKGSTAIILLELHNGGGSQNWGHQFPSMTHEQLNMLDETTFISCDGVDEANEAFERLALACAENGTSGLISGKMTLITPKGDGTDCFEWDLDSKTRPILEDGVWGEDIIVDRI